MISNTLISWGTKTKQNYILLFKPQRHERAKNTEKLMIDKLEIKRVGTEKYLWMIIDEKLEMEAVQISIEFKKLLPNFETFCTATVVESFKKCICF